MTVDATVPVNELEAVTVTEMDPAEAGDARDNRAAGTATIHTIQRPILVIRGLRDPWISRFRVK